MQGFADEWPTKLTAGNGGPRQAAGLPEHGHMPRPTAAPIVLASGLTLAALGVATSLSLAAIGAGVR